MPGPAAQHPLNGHQRMMLHWESLHPINAIHLIRLGEEAAAARIADAIRETVTSMGLVPVEFHAGGRSMLVPSPEGAATGLVDPAGTPEISLTELTAPDAGAIAGILARELNTCFPPGMHWPIRFRIVSVADAPQLLLTTYRHVVSDAHGILLLVRGIVRTLAGLPLEGPTLRLRHPPLSDLFAGSVAESAVKRLFWGVEDVRRSIGCRVPAQTGAASGAHRLEIHVGEAAVPLEAVRRQTRSHGVTISVLLQAALVEAVANTLPREGPDSQTARLAFYLPADLRRHAGADTQDIFGQMLGYAVIHASARTELPFPERVAQVAAEAAREKNLANYLRRIDSLQLMARLWSSLPLPCNERIWPALIPLAGSLSSVDVSRSLQEECGSRILTEYRRFTGTGPLIPLIVSATGFAGKLSLTATYQASRFDRPSIDALLASMLRRAAGEAGAAPA